MVIESEYPNKSLKNEVPFNIEQDIDAMED